MFHFFQEKCDGLLQTLTAKKIPRTCSRPDWLQSQKPRSAFAATVGRTDNLIEALIGQIADGKKFGLKSSLLLAV
jgi:hypothetical protein